MENERFYIKYLDYQPVKIETHFNGELERKRPLTDVGGLVAAYKTAAIPLLASTFVGDITIHYVVNGVETNYNSWDPIAALGTNGSYDHPLIIRSLRDTITMDEHMNLEEADTCFPVV
ncbi:hypothetical protein O5D80_000085 [Batrachochytrium dendrobatidis]|nr:hypothetical protein O5D80_000085 [Batrachochytrium dendrobatidis]